MEKKPSYYFDVYKSSQTWWNVFGERDRSYRMKREKPRVQCSITTLEWREITISLIYAVYNTRACYTRKSIPGSIVNAPSTIVDTLTASCSYIYTQSVGEREWAPLWLFFFLFFFYYRVSRIVKSEPLCAVINCTRPCGSHVINGVSHANITFYIFFS